MFRRLKYRLVCFVRLTKVKIKGSNSDPTMVRSDGGSAGDEARVAAAVAAGYRANGHRCRVVNLDADTYVRVHGGGRDELVWVRHGTSASDEGLSRFVLECDRYGVSDRRILSTDAADPVAGHARSLGIEFSGPAELASALQAADVAVPFDDGLDSGAEAPTSETTGSDPSTPSGGLLSRLGGVLLTALALGAAVVRR